jgi:hypothetical protein
MYLKLNEGQTTLRVALKFHSVGAPNHPTPIKAVVDSGAVWTAIREDVFNRLTPRPVLRSASLKFRGAGNEPLRVTGMCELCFRLSPQSPLITTIAFVFPTLAEPMLLGTNTLVKHGMVIDLANLHLSHGTPKPLPVDAAPLITDRPTTPRSELFAAQRLIFKHSPSAKTLYCLMDDGRLVGTADTELRARRRSGRGRKEPEGCTVYRLPR